MKQDLWHLVRGRAVKPRVAETFSISDDFEDDRTGDDLVSAPTWADEFKPISGYAFVIIYADSKGNRTERLVTCQRLDQCFGEIYLWAWCHSRMARRQFKISRILEIFDARSGESLGDPEAVFYDFQIDRLQKSKPGWGLGVQARADFVALLNVLVFIARCDREYHPLERATFEDAVCRFWLRWEAAGEPDCSAILDHCDRLAPDAETFYVALERCTTKPKLSSLVKESVRSVVDADGRHAREEIYWGTQIDDYFAGSG